MRLHELTEHTCLWKQDSDSNWFTKCGEGFIFDGGTPRENGFVWCPYCGGKLRQRRVKL